MIELTTFVALLDKLKELLKFRNAEDRVLFDMHLTPIFKDLKAIHVDYRDAIREAGQSLRGGASPAAVAEVLRQKKWEMQPERDQFTATANAFADRKHRRKSVERFFYACAVYFSSLGSSSIFTAVIRQLESPLPNCEKLQWAGGVIETRWKQVCTAHALAKAQLL